MSSARLHRPSMATPRGEDAAPTATPEPLTPAILAHNNVSVASTPFLVTSMKPFVPTASLKPGEPYTSKPAWKGVISGIRALQRLRVTGGASDGPSTVGKNDLVVVSGHEGGHVMVWSADSLNAIGSCTHYNNVTVAQVIVTSSYIYTRVERDSAQGKPGDDDSVYVWDLSTMTRKAVLTAHDDRVSALAVADEDEACAASGGVDRVVYVWNAASPAKPRAKLEGHASTITRLLISGHLLVSCAADGNVRTWNIGSATQIASVDGHVSNIAFLEWVTPYMQSVRALQQKRHSEKRKSVAGLAMEGSATFGTQKSQAAMNVSMNDDDDIGPYGTFITSCISGTVRFWHASKSVLESPWNTKAHRSFITDVCWDEDLFITASAAESHISFYRVGRTATARGITDTEGGVRNLCVDRTRKVVVAGTDNGHLCIWSYQALHDHPDEVENSVSLLMSLQPHTSSITSLLVERAPNGSWERLVTASADNTLTCFDFNPNRDAKAMHGAGAKAFAIVDFNSSLVCAQDNTLAVWDPETMTKKNIPRRSLEGHRERISGVRYSPQYRKLITASDDGTLRTWDVVDEMANIALSSSPEPGVKGATAAGSTERPPTKDESYYASNKVDLGLRVTCVSEPLANLVAVGTQKSNSRTGSISLVDIVTGVEVIAPAVTSVFPSSLHLHLQTGKAPPPVIEGFAKPPGWWMAPVTNNDSPSTTPERGGGRGPSSGEAGIRYFFVVAQLRNGETVLWHGAASPNFTTYGLRTVLPPQFEFQLELESTFTEPTPILSSLDQHFQPPRVVLAHVTENGQTLKKESFQVSSIPGKADVTRFPICANPQVAVIAALCNVGQSGVATAIGNDDGTVLLTTEAGKKVATVHYDGAVDDHLNEGAVTTSRRRCLYKPGPHAVTHVPGVCCVSATADNRCVTIGYRDGVIVVYDMVQRKVSRRLAAHVSLVRAAFVCPGVARVISMSASQTLRFDTLYGRHVKHQGDTDADAVRIAFGAGSGQSS